MDKAGNSEVGDLFRNAFLRQRNKGLTIPGGDEYTAGMLIESILSSLLWRTGATR